MKNFHKTNITVSFHRAHYAHQCGLSLMELLVSLLIFSTGILSMGQLQTHAIHTTTLNLQTKKAIQLAQQMAETITANSVIAIQNSYEINFSTSPGLTACTPICTAQQHILNSLSKWKRKIHAQLPDGNGSISKSANTYQIFITWSQTGQSTSPHCNTTQTAVNEGCFSYQVSIL